MTDKKAIRIELTRVEAGGKRIEFAPDGMSIGGLELRAWEVYPIAASAEVRDGRDCYLIKVNYDLELAPGSGAMNWFQVGFAFSAETGEPVFVKDAIPRCIEAPVEERSYTLTNRLLLVPSVGDMSTDAHLPVLADDINVFGIGGKRVRWSHLARPGHRISSGSHVAWAVVLVPKDCAELTVEFFVKYGLGSDDMIDYEPTQEPKSFIMELREAPEKYPVIEPSLLGDARIPYRTAGPRAFICYAHDSEEHVRLVGEFAYLLVRLGVDVEMDKFKEGKRIDWAVWSIQSIEDCPFTLIVASPKCREAGAGRLPSKNHRGIQSELALIRDKLHEDREHWTPRLLPVVLPGEVVKHIPAFLLPQSGDHYPVTEMAERGVEGLLRAMGRDEKGEWPAIQSGGEDGQAPNVG